MFDRTKKIVPLKAIKILKYISDIDYRQVFLSSEEEKFKLLNEVKVSLIDYFSESIDLSEFNYFYITSGITDGLNYLHNQNINSKFMIAPGDYEYLKYLNNNSSGDTITYVSNPSSIDGNFIKNWDNILQNQRIVLDCAYLGTTKTKKININDNVETVLLGLSKTFGLYENRVGYIFTNKKINLLHGIIYDNCYFNTLACIQTLKILNKFKLGYINQLYSEQQEKICKEYRLTPSDVCFIGTSNDIKYSFYKRGETNRLCLTEKIKTI